MRISKAIRAKRFSVLKEKSVTLRVETELGETLKYDVENCSLLGIGVVINKEKFDSEALRTGSILPESKILWQDQEFSLGRLAVKGVRETETHAFVGLSLIDTKLPLTSDLGKMFKELANGESNPYDFELSSKKFNLASFHEADMSHPDLFHKCTEYAFFDKDLKKNPLYQYYTIRHEIDGTRIELASEERKSAKSYINFSSYDYFGLACDPAVKEAAIKAIEKFGLSSMASPTLGGKTILHEELEDKLSKLLKKEACYLYSSGFAANIGVITAILRHTDLGLADIYSHASLVDALNASRSKTRYFKHNDFQHMENQLLENRNEYSGVLTVTEGLFSMDGDVPNLKKFVDITKKYGGRTLVDEVHSFGIFGTNGLGAAEEYEALEDIDIYTGSLSKGPGTGGGFVCASKEVINWMKSFTRSGIFSSAISPAYVGGGIKAIDLLFKDGERREKLLKNILYFRNGLKKLGYQPISHEKSPIIPVVIGDEKKIARMNNTLREFGIFVNPIVYPAVATNASRFRFSITCLHSKSDLDIALLALKKAFQELEDSTTSSPKAA
jgi:8-amino-7-oxononanoate synthase